METNIEEGTPAALFQFSPGPCTTEERAARDTASQIAKQLGQQPQFQQNYQTAQKKRKHQEDQDLFEKIKQAVQWAIQPLL